MAHKGNLKPPLHNQHPNQPYKEFWRLKNLKIKCFSKKSLKIAAALKRFGTTAIIKFDVPIAFGGKTVFVIVLAKNPDGLVVGVKCSSKVQLSRLVERIAQLRNYLSIDSYIIVVFPEAAGDYVTKATKVADEVWVTGKNGTVEQMMFTSVFHQE